MADEKIELVDREYNNCPRDNPSRQIRTRKSSFSTIREKFNAWRLRRLQRQLENKKEQAVTQGYTTRNYDEKITKKAEVIARLEEKIKILSREDVPENYVARRAIKLRQKMIANLTYNSGVYYTVGIEHMEEIFEDEEKKKAEEAKKKAEEEKKKAEAEKADAEKKETEAKKAAEKAPEAKEGMAAAAPADKKDPINVVPSDLERKDIVDAVNSSFDEMEKKPLTPTGTISSAEVKEVINEKLDQTDKKPEPVDTTAINKQAVKEAVMEAFATMENGKQAEQPVVKEAHSEPVIQESHPVEDNRSQEERILEAIRRVQVSRNNGKAVKASLFDANGNRVERKKKYDYKPMTDEEIREAQIKLGFDEHGNLLSSNKPKTETVETARVVGNYVAPGSIPSVSFTDAFEPVQKPVLQDVALRDKPVVVPDRDGDGLEREDGENMFKVIDREEPKAEEPVKVEVPVDVQETGTTMTLDDYTALKEKILRLQQQREVTRKNREEAEKREQEARERATEARKQYELSQANFNARMQKLREYADRLQAACDENVSKAEEANRNARLSDQYVQQQRSQADQTNRKIEELDSMLADAPQVGEAVVRR